MEAAIRFLEKLGPSIEEKLVAEAGGAKPTGGKSKITQEDYDGILAKFEHIYLSSEEGKPGVRVVCKRIQKLI